MVDKIMYTNSNLVTIVFDHRPPMVITTTDGTAVKLALDILGLLELVNDECKERIGKL